MIVMQPSKEDERDGGVRRLIGEAAIAARLDALATELTAFYRGKPLTVVAILNGSLIFAADLLRRIPLPLHLDCVGVASYHGKMESSGDVTFLQTRVPDLSGRHVLLIDDILETGQTLYAVREKLIADGNPIDVHTAVLLRKKKALAHGLAADWIGFEIEDPFVVGYGLDYQGHYRNLPYIGIFPSFRRG